MAKTIAQAFSNFKSALEITDLQHQTVSNRQKNVRNVLATELKVIDSFLTGSYSRSTMIAPVKEADVDIFIVLDPSYYRPDGQASLLDRVKRVLRREYPNTPDISRNGQAVTIVFSDFIMDVVPGFYKHGGGYLIPNTQGGTWIATDPGAHVKISSDTNVAHDGDLVPLVKMLKRWNREIGYHFRSFHLEILAWAIFENVTISSFPSGVRFFFDKGRSLIASRNPDPAGYDGDVGY